jgi:site-specific DNA recombinase
MEKRAAVYMRVSTTRQADHDLSIPDQLRKAEDYCALKGWDVAATYEERGASGRSDRRPEFQRLIEDACSREHPFDIVLVHSLSRFARDAVDVALYERKLEKVGVKLVSITQDFSDDANGKLLRQIIAAVDEKQSADNAVHTLRAMQENARQGFWNGSQPPLGYETYAAERRGDKTKKRLRIAEHEAEIVRQIFRLYVQGDGRSGPMGLKKVASYLNERGFRTRHGKRFSIQYLHKVLTNHAYIGKAFFNQNDSRTRKPKPREEWIQIPVPAIVDEDTFDAAQRLLAERNPKQTPPRVTNNPVLLSGAAHCSKCGSRMRLRTGKGGQYRYYTCAGAADKGKSACKGYSIPEATLDGIVLDAFEQRILDPDRLTDVLANLTERATGSRSRMQDSLKALNKERREVEARLERLYAAIEDGTVPVDGTLRKRVARLQERREELIRLASINERRLSTPLKQVTPGKVDQFAKALRQRLRNGSPEFRKNYLRQFIANVDVGPEEIRISGPKEALLESAADGADMAAPVVRTFEQEWRTRQDSNL